MFFIDFIDGLGGYLRMLFAIIAKPEKVGMYWRETLRQMYDIGVGSFGIIAIVSLFIGGVTAVQFSYKLISLSFIPMWWMGGMVRDTMVLELAPTITALLLAGKIGSNIATEIGTMRISEQIDAMDIMGVNTISYLVGPKIAGGVLITPTLVIFAMFLGTLGGCLAGEIGGFYSVDEYVFGLQDDFNPHYINVMLVKSIIFPFLITSISCYQGFYVKGGALELGKASTNAVVYSSISIVIANFLIAFVML